MFKLWKREIPEFPILKIPWKNELKLSDKVLKLIIVFLPMPDSSLRGRAQIGFVRKFACYIVLVVQRIYSVHNTVGESIKCSFRIRRRVFWCGLRS